VIWKLDALPVVLKISEPLVRLVSNLSKLIKSKMVQIESTARDMTSNISLAIQFLPEELLSSSDIEFASDPGSNKHPHHRLNRCWSHITNNWKQYISKILTSITVASTTSHIIRKLQSHRMLPEVGVWNGLHSEINQHYIEQNYLTHQLDPNRDQSFAYSKDSNHTDFEGLQYRNRPTEHKDNEHEKDPSQGLRPTDMPCDSLIDSALEYEGDYIRLVDLASLSSHSPSALPFCLLHLIEALAADPHVLSVSIERSPELLNYAARGVLQAGQVGVEPFTALGLTGEGEVVGVADSGLNDLSCFFADNGVALSGTVKRSSLYDNYIEPKRRKVIQYISYGDGSDVEGGHGTHVCASLVGKSLNSQFSAANGMLPSAKVAFLDIEKTGDSVVTIPDLSDVLQVHYDLGVRVHSNSWGSSSYGQ